MSKISKFILTIALITTFICSLLVGTAYALFDDKSDAEILVTTGTFNVERSLSKIDLYYNGEEDDDGWALGGQSFFNTGELKLKMVSGCGITIVFNVVNRGSLAGKWRMIIVSGNEFFARLNVFAQDECDFVNRTDTCIATNWQSIEPPEEGKKTFSTTISISFEYYSAEDELFEDSAVIYFEAVHGNTRTTNGIDNFIGERR